MLMGAHMLRLRLGDQKFTQFLQRFYREHRERCGSGQRGTSARVRG